MYGCDMYMTAIAQRRREEIKLPWSKVSIFTGIKYSSEID